MYIQKHLKPITWLPMLPHGYACGYVGVPPEHPWYGKHYNDILEVSVHGGLTHSGPLKDFDSSLWWVGFDTAHGGDNKINCDEKYCEQELESLYQQALKTIP